MRQRLLYSSSVKKAKKRFCLRGKISLNVETDAKRKKSLKEYVDENYS